MRVSVYLLLCPSLEPNLTNHFYATGLFLYPLKTSEDLSFLKGTILSHTHTYTHTLKCLQSKESQLQRRIQFCENS